MRNLLGFGRWCAMGVARGRNHLISYVATILGALLIVASVGFGLFDVVTDVDGQRVDCSKAWFPDRDRVEMSAGDRCNAAIDDRRIWILMVFPVGIASAALGGVMRLRLTP